VGFPSEEWNAAARRLAGLEPAARWKSEDVKVLYRLALAHGPTILARFQLDTSRVHDLVADLVSVKLDQLVEAEVPAPYFLAALGKAATSWVRRPAAAVAPEPEIERAGPSDASAEAKVELERVSGRLKRDELEIFAALAAGEDRDAIASALGTSRANIDQKVSRARKRLREEGFE